MLQLVYGGIISNTVLAEPIYMDVSGGIPVVSSPSAYYWTSIPFDGLHSSVTQIAPGHWSIDIGLGGAYRSLSNSNLGLGLTDPGTGIIVDSFGVNLFAWNNAYSWTTIYTELFTTDASGQLAGRTTRINDAQVNSEALVPGSYQLAVSGINTEWSTFEIYLKGMSGPQPPIPAVPLPATIFLFGSGLAGLIGSKVRRKQK
ncbi:MAG: PEP-CTERM sorting domain-containing protein [Methylobacter sp.]|nr:PEP-CTERM sorting domain-containing protein [Methylobacter sp.]